MNADSGATIVAVGMGRPEARLLVRPAVGIVVLQRDEKAARMHLLVLVVGAAPCVDIERSVRPHDHLAGVADIVGEDGGAEALRQGEAAVVAGALAGFGDLRRVGWLRALRAGGRGKDGREGSRHNKMAGAVAHGSFGHGRS